MCHTVLFPVAYTGLHLANEKLNIFFYTLKGSEDNQQFNSLKKKLLLKFHFLFKHGLNVPAIEYMNI